LLLLLLLLLLFLLYSLFCSFLTKSDASSADVTPSCLVPNLAQFKDRGEASLEMARALKQWLKREVQNRRVDGCLGLGGSGGMLDIAFVSFFFPRWLFE
jgi:uncharacterized protein (UPF0261 family)